MRLAPLLAVTAAIATPVFAQEVRQTGSHEHGVGQLNIAFDGTQIAMELHAPGADIVGFEYEAETAEDLAKIEAALRVLEKPLTLFVLPDAAQCRVTEAHAGLEGEDLHDDHGDHKEHGEHGDEDHAEEGHDDEEHHEKHEGHTEFHAEYLLNCADISAVKEVSFAYFAAFPNAAEVEVQLISEAGATAFEVPRDAPVLDLGDLK